MISKIWIALFVCYVTLISCTTDVSLKSIKVQYSFNGKDFNDRASIHFKPPSSYIIPKDAMITKSIKIDQHPLSTEDIQYLSSLLKEDSMFDNLMYTLRIEKENSFVSTSVSACALLTSHLQDQWTIHLSSVDDEIYAISMIPNDIQCDKEIVRSFLKSGKKNFKTTVSISTGEMGSKPKQIDLKKEEKKEEGSWLSRYWYYIVPIPIVLILMQFLAPASDE